MGCTPTCLGVCSGAFHCSQKHQTLNKVYFPFRALYKMTQHLGTFMDSWALAGSAWNHYPWCTGGGRHGVGSRDWVSRSQAEPLESQVSSSLTWGVQFYKDFPPKGVCRTQHICLTVDE